MKRSILLLVSLLTFISSISVAWEITGNLNVHEEINDFAVKLFLSKYGNNKDSSKYKTSPIDEVASFSGIAWHNGQKTVSSANNAGVTRNWKFAEWVQGGGFDADITALWASDFEKKHELEKPLRHFYDPLSLLSGLRPR